MPTPNRTPDINQILRKDPVDCRYGAPLGARNKINLEEPVLYVQQIHFVDGDYSPDGTYWGGPVRLMNGRMTDIRYLWCGFNATNRIFVRAYNRIEAIHHIEEIDTDFKFHRRTLRLRRAA